MSTPWVKRGAVKLILSNPCQLWGFDVRPVIMGTPRAFSHEYTSGSGVYSDDLELLNIALQPPGAFRSSLQTLGMSFAINRSFTVLVSARSKYKGLDLAHKLGIRTTHYVLSSSYCPR